MTTTDLRYIKPTCPSCGERKEGIYEYDESFDDLICKSCRERDGLASPVPRAEPPFGARSRHTPVDRVLGFLADLAASAASARSAAPGRIP